MMCLGVCFLGFNFFGTLSFLDFLEVTSFRYLPGRGNPGHCIVVVYVGEGYKREQCH